jgi:hypothetical protein
MAEPSRPIGAANNNARTTRSIPVLLYRTEGQQAVFMITFHPDDRAELVLKQARNKIRCQMLSKMFRKVHYRQHVVYTAKLVGVRRLVPDRKH